jgi:hypothetical protein
VPSSKSRVTILFDISTPEVLRLPPLLLLPPPMASPAGDLMPADEEREEDSVLGLEVPRAEPGCRSAAAVRVSLRRPLRLGWKGQGQGRRHGKGWGRQRGRPAARG